MGVQWQAHVGFSRALIHPVEMTDTVEYRGARAAKKVTKAGRVFAVGPPSYWLNVFTDLPQAGGGTDEALPTREMADAIYRLRTITDDSSGSETLTWLRALGVDLAIVDRAHFFTSPSRFAAAGKLVWSEGTESLYAVPRRSRSLAHVMPLAALIPATDMRVQHVQRYVAALESDRFPEATFRWLSTHSAQIRAKLAAGQVISVQVTHDPGWRAWGNGIEQRIRKDGMGFMSIQPACRDCDIRLEFTESQERSVCNLIACACAASLALVAAWAIAAEPPGARRTCR